MIKHGIERQMLSITMVPIMVLAMLLGGYFTYVLITDLEKAELERARLIVHQLASSSEYPVFSGDLGLLQQQLDAADSEMDVSSVVILDANSNFVAGAGVNRNLPVRHAWSSSVKGVKLLQEDLESMWLYQPIVATQIELDEVGGNQITGKTLGYAFIEYSKIRMNQQKIEMLLFNFLLTLLTMVATLLIALRVSRRITRPVMGMSNAVRNIGEGRLDTRIGAARVRELDVLASGINEMAQQLQLDRDTLEKRIREATQELRNQKEDAEKANHDKSRFLAAASHDLRQPMHALGLFVGELLNRVDNPNQLKIVGKIEESVDALSGLLDALLDISKLDAGVVIPQVKMIEVNAMLERMAKDMAHIAQRKSIDLKWHLSDSSTVLSDPVLLERILLNLLGNAVRYTPQNGRILLACRRRGDYLQIEVRDNGIGIPPDEQKNVFREFIQLENKARDRSKGLGLGLAIVDRLAKLLHHPLTLRSEVGRGSVFSIRVPFVQDWEGLPDEPDEHAIESSPLDVLEGLRVLVVDDDPLVRTGTGGILSSWGCNVTLVEDMQEAEAECPKSTFDVVICDYRLPGGSGIELADMIKAHCEKPPAFILVSGDTAPDVLKAVNERNLLLLHKPVRPAKLRSLIFFLLKQKDSAGRVPEQG